MPENYAEVVQNLKCKLSCFFITSSAAKHFRHTELFTVHLIGKCAIERILKKVSKSGYI